MKKKTFPIFFLILLSLAALSATAQSWNRVFSFDFTYSNLPHDDKLQDAMKLMADNNGVSVLGLHLHLSYQASLSLTVSKAGIPVLRYKVGLLDVSGNTKFHGFNIDTLLVPTRLVAVIQVYQNNQLLDSLTQTMALHREQVLLPVSGRAPLSSLYVTFRVVRAEFTEADYRKLIGTTNQINAYYGYRQIIKELPDILLKTNDIHPEASVLFYNYVALSRLAGHIRAHHFTRHLHLDKRDPLHFRKAFASLLRKQMRMKTLSEEVMKNGKPAPVMQKVRFARDYAALSMKAITLSKQHQPYLAGSFREFARIFPHSSEIHIADLAARYFDKNDKPGQATLAQEIYKNFVEAASFYFREQAYVSALDMLANASRFEKNFTEVMRIAEFDTVLTGARDGLSASYLKVARMASQHHDFQLAGQYLQKAFRSLKTFDTVIPAPAHPVCYARFSHGMRRMAVESRERQQFSRAVFYLDKAQEACPRDPRTDSLRREVCRALQNYKVTDLEQMIQNKPIPVAYDSLMAFRNYFSGLCRDSLPMQPGSALNNLTGKIFRELLRQSQQLQQQKEASQAMQYLNLARRLQQRFLLSPSPLLDSLIKQTTVPYILSVIRSADLEIWRKNFGKADSVYRLSLALSRQYGVQNNKAIQHSLNSLHEKIGTTGCRWRLGQARLLLEKTGRDLAAYRMDEARSCYLKAKQFYTLTSACRNGNTETDSLLSAYEKLFRFTDAYHRLTQQLFSEGFGKVLPRFAALEQIYHRQHLERFGVPFTGMYAFVKNQHSDGMTLEAVRYFAHNGNFKTALRYLLLLSHPAQAKAEQKLIAAGFAEQNRVPKQKVLNDPAFAAFAKTYWKALAAKEK